MGVSAFARTGAGQYVVLSPKESYRESPAANSKRSGDPVPAGYPPAYTHPQAAADGPGVAVADVAQPAPHLEALAEISER